MTFTVHAFDISKSDAREINISQKKVLLPAYHTICDEKFAGAMYVEVHEGVKIAFVKCLLPGGTIRSISKNKEALRSEVYDRVCAMRFGGDYRFSMEVEDSRSVGKSKRSIMCMPKEKNPEKYKGVYDQKAIDKMLETMDRATTTPEK